MGDGYFLLTNLLSEDEKRVITSITAHIERGEKRVGIQQIANENFLSTTTIVKMCKRLGFDGYSELYYYLSRQFNSHGQDRSAENIKSLRTLRHMNRPQLPYPLNIPGIYTAPALSLPRHLYPAHSHHN